MYIERDVTDIEGLCASLSGHDRVLCVVNTRKLAYDVYSRLKATGKEVFHLSRMMCQAHILDTINGIKEALRRPEGEVRVVSTQLIEAGVDIDFPVVYRQMAGLNRCCRRRGVATGRVRWKRGMCMCSSSGKRITHRAEQ